MVSLADPTVSVGYTPSPAPPRTQAIAAYQALATEPVLLRLDTVDPLADTLTIERPFSSEPVRLRLDSISKLLRGTLPSKKICNSSGSPANG